MPSYFFIHIQIGVAQIRAIPRSLLGISVYVAHVIPFAMIAKRFSKTSFKYPVADAAFHTLGYAMFGFYIWAAGYLSLLNFRFFFGSAVAWALLAFFLNRGHRLPMRLFASARSAASLHPIFVGACAGMLAISILSGLRGISFDDDYKWQSALAWVHAGHWVKVPYRLTNGPAMSEMLHVPAALCGTLTSAHWASTGLWVCAALNAAALGRLLQVSTPITLIAVLSVTIFTTSASTLNSDVTSLAFLLGGLVLILDCDDRQFSWRRAILAGVLFAAGMSCKFLVLAALPATFLVLFFRLTNPLLSRLYLCTMVLVPVVLVICLWLAHTYHLTGSPVDRSGKHMARTPDDPMWMDGEAAGRIPRAKDLLRLPIEPFLTTIWGQEEPFGGRTGLLWLLMLPATLGLLLKNKIPWRMPLILFSIAVSFYLLLGPFVLKTRFLMLFFIMMAILAAAAYQHRHLFPKRIALAISILFVATAGLGILDGTRKLLFEIILDTPPARHAPRVI